MITVVKYHLVSSDIHLNRLKRKREREFLITIQLYVTKPIQLVLWNDYMQRQEASKF